MGQESEQRLMELMRELSWKVSRELHDHILRTPIERLAAVDRESEDDTIYAIDQEIEGRIVDFFERRVGPEICVKLIMEGSPAQGMVFGGSGKRSDAEFTILMDPIDGTRGLMYGKRSAWLLCGMAPGSNPDLNLSHITMAAQTEIPCAKQFVADQLWAFGGQGVSGLRRNLETGREEILIPLPSRAKDLHYGFVTFNRFFPMAKDVIVAVEMELNRRLAASGRESVYFEDQYICNGGQLAALAMGHDRLVCDLRAIISDQLVARGREPLLSSHPYDLSAELVAREAGAIVTGPTGLPLDAPLDTTTGVTWIGYANNHIRELIEPHLLEILAAIGDFI